MVSGTAGEKVYIRDTGIGKYIHDVGVAIQEEYNTQAGYKFTMCVECYCLTKVSYENPLVHHLCHSGESEITLEVGDATRLALTVHPNRDASAWSACTHAPCFEHRDLVARYALAVLVGKNFRHSTHIRGLLR